MKKIMILVAGLAAWTASALGAEKSVPLTIVVPEQAEYVPAVAQSALADKMRRIVNVNGMGATDDAGQFFITCVLNVTDKQVVSGAPVKVAQKIDATFYVADAFNQRVFGTTTVSLRGVGNNESKAVIAAVQQLSPDQSSLKALIRNANAKILAYYEEQCDNILQKARTLAKARAYEQAFYQLSLVPEECACYSRILGAADALFQDYVDYRAQQNLAAARSAWSAGMNRDAAMEAAEYLAEILPDASCYAEAQELLKEIKSRVKDDIEFDRQLVRWEQENKAAIIKSWREIGVAYGNHQQPVTYTPGWLLR